MNNKGFKNNIIDYKTKMNKLLKNSRTTRKTSTFFTHVSMGDTMGRYTFNQDNMSRLFDLCATYRGTEGIAEMPQKYSMLRFDFDFEESSTVIRPLFNINIFLNDIIKKLQMYLKQNIVDFKPQHADCCILTKDPYLKEGKTIKHGLHLQFPNTFVSKDDFKIMEEHFKDLEGMDTGMASKPWLLYEQSKAKGKGTYTAEYVLTHDGVILQPKDYFEDYKVYNRGQTIKFKKNIEHYYPRIFSIIPLGREDLVVEMKHMKKTETSTYKTQWEDCDDEVHKYEDEIKEVVDTYITDEMDDCFSVGDWNGNFLQLKRTKTFICPTTKSREHDNRGAYCTINTNNGKVYLGCYCNEGKSVPIGTYKTDETVEKKTDNAFDLDCDEAKEIYISRDKNSLKRHDGKTYGFIAQEDYEFADWICNNYVHPHAKIFCKILGREFEEDCGVIKLDNTRPNEVINQNNIGSYVPRLEKADVVCMRSNMMTFKTQNLKELMEHYKRVLIVSFRVSLEDEYMETFKDYNFELYSDFKGIIIGDRIVTQVDSLYKVRGEFDLLVLDEIVYTMEHLHSFVKRKQEVWEALNQYIDNTKKIVACDALLDNKTIKLFKNSGRSTWIVENKWESFKGKKFKFIDFENFGSTVKYIVDNIKEWGSLYIPTNSKTFADKIFYYLREQGLKVGMDSSETEPTPSDEWKQYELFITTPTNVAGVSCNDEFGKTICYFTSASCSASMCSQMMFRVRNTKSDTYDIFIKKSNMGINYPIRTNEIKQWINCKDDLVLKSGLKINHIRNKIVEDDYYNNYIGYIKKENLSKVMFKQVLRGILQVHGLEEIKEKKEETRTMEEILKEMKELDEIKDIAKELHEKEKKISRENVCEALPLTDEQFKEIDEKYRKTKDEKLSLRRYHLEKTYGGDFELTEENIKTFEKIMPQYKNLQTMNCNKDNLQDYIETTINQHEKEHLRDDNTQRLHEKRNLLKIWTAHNLVKMLGFDNIYDTRTIKGYPYEKAREFLIQHGDNISLLFGGNKVNWNNVNVNDKEGKREISYYITGKLKSVCHISVSNKHRGRGKNAQKEEYIIKGLDIWAKGGLVIPKNEYAERLYVEKNFKRLMTKTKVGDKLWKCVSELVEVKE